MEIKNQKESAAPRVNHTSFFLVAAPHVSTVAGVK
jgi:hypothetical protein